MPQEIMTSKEGSFARFTVLNRFPDILNDLIAGNKFPTGIEKGLRALLNSIPENNLTPLSDEYPFASDINRVIENNPQYTWLNAPFLFIENYLYHRICDVCDYYSNGFDFFKYKKEAEIIKGMNKFSGSLKKLNSITSFSEISLLNLMGNKSDLSQSSSYYSEGSAFELLIDHREKADVKVRNCSRIDFILDNSGDELFFDLLMAYWLLKNTGVQKIKLHFKQIPYFVSDALITDYRFLLGSLSHNRELQWFTDDMNNFESDGKMELLAEPFFSSGKLFSYMPEELKTELCSSDLLIFKGDLNYRRLIDDCYRPYETETSSLLKYFTTDILINRILKSEIIAGLTSAKIPARDRTDWMFSGEYGQIELIEA